jgi:hypothetical protein
MRRYTTEIPIAFRDENIAQTSRIIGPPPPRTPQWLLDANPHLMSSSSRAPTSHYTAVVPKRNINFEDMQRMAEAVKILENADLLALYAGGRNEVLYLLS